MPLFNLIIITCLVYWFVGVFKCVHRRWSIERHRKSMNFGREAGCVGPYLCAPPTCARVQSRFEFVELAREMCSICTRSHWEYRLLREQARGTRCQALYKLDNIGYWYVEVPEDHLFDT